MSFKSAAKIWRRTVALLIVITLATPHLQVFANPIYRLPEIFEYSDEMYYSSNGYSVNGYSDTEYTEISLLEVDYPENGYLEIDYPETEYPEISLPEPGYQEVILQQPGYQYNYIYDNYYFGEDYDHAYDLVVPLLTNEFAPTDTSLPFTIIADSGLNTLVIEAADIGEPDPPVEPVLGSLELTAGVRDIERDFDQTVWITVYNPTDNPVMYYLVSDNRYPAYELALNFVYTASIYEPTVILSGETQQVELSIFTQSAMRTSYIIPITAYVIENGTSSADTMEVLTLQVPAAELNLTIMEIAVDVNSLTRTFSIRNNGNDISDLTLSLAGDVAQFAHLSPGVSIYQLAQGETLSYIKIVPNIVDIYAAGQAGGSGWLVAQSGITTYTVPIGFDIIGAVEFIPLWRLSLLQAGNPYWDIELDLDSLKILVDEYDDYSATFV